MIFGSASQFPADFSLTSLDGSNGFTINGVTVGDSVGYSVSNAGDVNAELLVLVRLIQPLGIILGGAMSFLGGALPFRQPSTLLT